jgi:glycosyltransferase involved in cell wall biosynthesis
VRIIYVTSKLPHSSQEALIIPEIRELKRRGHEVLVVPMYPRGPMVHGEAKPMLEHSIVKPLFSPAFVRDGVQELWRAPLRALRAFGWLFRSRNANILLRSLAVYPKGLWLARLAREWNADHIHAHWASSTATLALVAGGVSGIPWSITAHRYDIPERSLLDIKAREVCFFRAEDKQGQEELLGYVRSKDFKPIMLHMGVDVPPVVNRKDPAEKQELRVVVPANLVEKKGHVYLLGALQLLKGRGVPVHADFAGDGELRGELECRIRELGLKDRVNFLGALPHDELMRQMQAGRWDMVVLPSIETAAHEKEGIPVALIEALGGRMPAVSTTTGGIPELFEGMEEALVPPEDPVSLAEAIERLLIKDPELRERLVESGRKRVEESFAIERVMDELIGHFEACAS